MSEYKIAKIDDLKPFPLRGIRQPVLDRLEERISNRYNPARPLIVVPDSDGKYLVADGNHRLEVLRKLGITEVPVLVQAGNPYSLSVQANEDENTYAPMDVFDWLEIIGKLRDEGYKQREIAETIGWSRENVNHYIRLQNNVDTDVLDFCKQHQEGRVSQNDTSVSKFNFGERWFRDSGIYQLNHKYQKEFIDWFVKGRGGPKTTRDKIEELKEIQEQIELIDSDFPDIEDREKEREKLVEAVERGEYSTERLKQVLENLKEKAENKALFGVDARTELIKLEDNSIDCVVTDPPWGVNFESARPSDNPNYDSGLEEVTKTIQEVFAELKRVTKENAHIYVFFPTTYYCEFKNILSKYFYVYPVPLIWVKNNHTPSDFKERYSSKYETIFFCKAENGDRRKLNYSVSPDVLCFESCRDRWHDSQKPIELLEYLINNSTGEREKVIDPFAGSGSTLLACAKNNRNYIGFEIDGSYESKFKKYLGDIHATQQ